MKKILSFALVAMLSIGSAMAQVNLKGVVGMNSSNMGDFSSKIGFHAGVVAEMPIAAINENVYASLGALLSLKGTKLDIGELGSGKYNSYYLEVPIHLGYKYNVNSTLSIWGEAGPYAAIGLFGKTTIKELEDIDEYIHSETKFDTFGDKGLKRFDMGAGLKVGLTFNQKYSFSIGYDWGFIDIYDGSGLEKQDEDYIDLTPSIKNKNLSISFGYTF